MDEKNRNSLNVLQDFASFASKGTKSLILTIYSCILRILIGLSVGWSGSSSLYIYITKLTSGLVTYSEKQDSGKVRKKKKKMNLTGFCSFCCFCSF